MSDFDDYVSESQSGDDDQEDPIENGHNSKRQKTKDHSTNSSNMAECGTVKRIKLKNFMCHRYLYLT